MSLLMRDGNGVSFQAFVPDPAKSQVNASMTGTIVFGSSTDDVNITNWSAIKVRPSADSTYYYNSDTTKTVTLPADTETLIWIGQVNVSTVTINFGSGTAEVQGM